VDPGEDVDFTECVRICAARLARDGVRALGDVYDVTASRLFRYATTLTRHRDDAEDALQATLVRIALRPNVLAEARFPWAYLLKIIRNEALNIVRRRKPMRRLHDQSTLGGDPSIAAAEPELHRIVRLALDKLPPAQAEVVVLKIWEEMTFSEIGEVLGQSPNTAASRYRYALQKLSQHLYTVGPEVRDG
jgi:RNA polymerase sigma-70 factor (ECF subfamily)